MVPIHGTLRQSPVLSADHDCRPSWRWPSFLGSLGSYKGNAVQRFQSHQTNPPGETHWIPHWPIYRAQLRIGIARCCLNVNQGFGIDRVASTAGAIDRCDATSSNVAWACSSRNAQSNGVGTDGLRSSGPRQQPWLHGERNGARINTAAECIVSRYVSTFIVESLRTPTPLDKRGLATVR